MDARVVRTKQALTQALFELIAEQRWDKITVQSLLDRTGISRSTFYAHYENKLDILLGNIPDTVDQISINLKDRTVNLKPLIHHVAGASEVLGPLLSQPVLGEILNEFERGFQKKFTQLIDTEDRPWLAAFMAGAVLAVVKHYASSKEQDDPESVAEELEIYLNQLLKS